MKKFTFLVILCSIGSFVMAQSRSTKVEYQKISRHAIENDVPFPTGTVEKALEDTFTKMGYKSTTSKGFTVYKGVKMPEFGSGTYDIYFMVDKKSRKDKENSVVTMMISKGFDAFIDESTDKEIVNRSKTYLDSLRNTLAAYDLEQQIIVQEDEVKAAEKRSVKLQEEAKDLEKKRKKLEDDIADNIKEQEKQVKELDKQKQILEVTIGKRKH